MFQKTNSTVSKNNEEKETLCYIEADKPLVYNFFDVTSLSQLTDKEPTSGKRKVNKKKILPKKKVKKETAQTKKILMMMN